MKEGWRGGDCIGRDGGGVGGVAEWKTAGAEGARGGNEEDEEDGRP